MSLFCKRRLYKMPVIYFFCKQKRWFSLQFMTFCLPLHQKTWQKDSKLPKKIAK